MKQPMQIIKIVHQANKKENFIKYNRAVYEGVKYPCRRCNYQATTKRHLAKHKRPVHKGVIYPCRQCDYQGTEMEVWFNTKGHIMNESNILAGNMIIKPLQIEVWLTTRGQHM